jgi:acetoin utilization protein AcuB
MFVSQSMTRRVITVEKGTGIFEAQEKLTEHRIRHLPVVDAEDRLIGIVTDRDIRSALPFSSYKDPERESAKENLADLTIGDIMTADPRTVSPEDTIQDALLLLQELRVGALPVVDRNRNILGIISVRDLMRAFINVLGIGQPGTLIGILVKEEIGQLKKIVDVVTEENVSIGSVLVARYWDEDKRAVFLYLLTQNIAHIKQKFKETGYTLLDPLDWHLDQFPRSK